MRLIRRGREGLAGRDLDDRLPRPAQMRLRQPRDVDAAEQIDVDDEGVAAAEGVGLGASRDRSLGRDS
jgi:hypothetical protein